MQHGCVLSMTLRKPGPTHSVFDVLAALIHLLAPGPMVALLGFAAGGLIPPLRALGGHHTIAGVDLARAGYDLFLEYQNGWHGKVTFQNAEAGRWLHQSDSRWNMIIDDLSIDSEDDVVKPPETFDLLPDIMSNRLVSGGLVMTNLLPKTDWNWNESMTPIIAPHRHAVAVHFDEFQNRILVAGSELIPATVLSRRLNKSLFAIGSRQARRVSVRTLK